MKAVTVEIDKIRNPYSGLGQFCLHLGQELIRTQADGIDLQFALAKSHLPFDDFGNYRFIHRLHHMTSGSANGNQLWHSTHQDSPYLPPKGFKYILTIHDLNFLEKYKSKIRHKWRLSLLQRKIKRADAITTISKYSAELIKSHLNIGDKPIHVIYNGCIDKQEDACTPMHPVKGAFLFTIGVIQARKNLEVLLPMIKQLNGFKLVIAGDAQAKCLEHLKKKIEELRIHNKVIFTGPITDGEKQWYFEHCSAFVFPSKSEGFGLPVIEAMNAGVPVFLSQYTCLPEIGGKLAHYWSDFSADQMINVLQKGLKEHNPAKSAELKQWAQQFSWSKAAADYWRLYKSLL